MRIILLHGKVNVLDMLRARASNRNGEHSGLARPRWRRRRSPEPRAELSFAAPLIEYFETFEKA